jgi:hypothetical protein
VRTWQALHGPERDVIFRQEHPPGKPMREQPARDRYAKRIAGRPRLLSRRTR